MNNMIILLQKYLSLLIKKYTTDFTGQ